VRILIDQLESSLGTGLYYLSLFTALAIPDIGGALDSDDGRANGDRYRAWYEKWVRPRFKEQVLQELPPDVHTHVANLQNPLTGDVCYRFRCSLLHQGTSQHPESAFTRIIFIEPGTTTNVIHYGIIDNGPTDRVLCIDLKHFCREVIGGTRLWLGQVESTEHYKVNYDAFARRHASGLAPYVIGVPVVG